MEIKINREILSYSETMFLGLSSRQLLFSILAVAAAVFTYFTASSLPKTVASWLSVLSAVPFALSGGGYLRGTMRSGVFLACAMRFAIRRRRLCVSRFGGCLCLLCGRLSLAGRGFNPGFSGNPAKSFVSGAHVRRNADIILNAGLS